VELTEAVGGAQGRLETSLMAWTADLDRGQRELEAQLSQLAQRQKEALAEYDARLHADAERLAAASEEQRKALAQLRTEFEKLITQFVEEGRNEVEAHAAERRRALHEVSERLRARERGLREQIDREEAESRSRVATGHAEAERRQLAQLEKALDRAATRLSEEAERRFDSQIKESRERSAERLSRELDKSIEEFVRQAESEVSDRIVELARQTADRMERRLRDVARAAEAQGEVAGERLRHVTERLDAALASAEQRIAAFEAEVDVRLESRLGQVERAGRVERD
jgi:DNA repair exonuclease SbcCD ATPase subunit